MSRLPGILQRFADVIGEQDARNIAQRLGGRRVYLAENPGPDNPIAQVIGVEAAARLAREIGGGEDIAIPFGPFARAPRIRHLLTIGWTHTSIASEVGVGVRTVEYHAQRMRQHNRPPSGAVHQLSLPLGDPDPET
ncbi:MAG: hypothetical protein AAGI34_10320 [Pseudomonadota bacterium]